MLANKFNPLRSTHEESAPANTGTAPTTPEAPPEKKADSEKEPEPEPETEPKAPEAPAAAAKPNAFQRGALRALGIGDLVARVERAEAAEAVATAENIRLTTELNKLQAETPTLVAAATLGRENEVSRAVTAELVALGLTPEAAPSKISTEDDEKTKTRAEYSAMTPRQGLKFIQSGGKLTD